MRNFAINVGLAMLSIVLLFMTIEGGLRIIGRSPMKSPPPLYVQSKNPNVSYTLRPNAHIKALRSTITMDDQGFRVTPKPTLAPSPIPYPLLPILGDSLVFGYGVEDYETLPAEMQRLLPEWHVLNAGVPGYTLRQERSLYEERVARLDPSALVLVFYWNDLTDGVAVLDDKGILHIEGWIPGNSDCRQPDVGPFSWNPLHCFLMERSAFYHSYYKLANTLYGKQTLREEREASKEDPRETIADDVLQAYERELSAFVETLPRNLPRLFVIWPERFLHPVATPELRRIAEKNGFIVLDLTERFGNEVPTLSWDTVHPSPEALAEAASLIVEALRSTGIMPMRGTSVPLVQGQDAPATHGRDGRATTDIYAN